jgi:hypothetical protein
VINTYKFNLESTDLVLRTPAGNSDCQQQVIEPWPKPVHVIRSRGWLVMNAPMALEKALGRTRLQMTRSALVQLCAHFETEQAMYQLHVATRVQLKMRE